MALHRIKSFLLFTFVLVSPLLACTGPVPGLIGLNCSLLPVNDIPRVAQRVIGENNATKRVPATDIAVLDSGGAAPPVLLLSSFYDPHDDFNGVAVLGYDVAAHLAYVVVGHMNQTSAYSFWSDVMESPSAAQALTSIDVILPAVPSTPAGNVTVDNTTIRLLLSFAGPLSQVIELQLAVVPVGRSPLTAWNLVSARRIIGANVNFTVTEITEGQPALSPIPPPTDVLYRPTTGELFLSSTSSVYRVSPQHTIETFVGGADNPVMRPAYRLDTRCVAAAKMALLGDTDLLIPDIVASTISMVSFETGVISLVVGMLHIPPGLYGSDDSCLASVEGCDASAFALWAANSVAVASHDLNTLYATSAGFQTIFRINIAQRRVWAVGGGRPSQWIALQKSTDPAMLSSMIHVTSLAVVGSSLYISTSHGIATIPTQPSAPTPAGATVFSTQIVILGAAAALLSTLTVLSIAVRYARRRRLLSSADVQAAVLLHNSDATPGEGQLHAKPAAGDTINTASTEVDSDFMEALLSSGKARSSEPATARGHRGWIRLPVAVTDIDSARSVSQSGSFFSASRPRKCGPFSRCAADSIDPSSSIPDSIIAAAMHAAQCDTPENSADYENTVESSTDDNSGRSCKEQIRALNQ